MTDRNTLFTYMHRREKLDSLPIKTRKIYIEIQNLDIAIQILIKKLKKAHILCNCCSSCLEENFAPI